MKRGRFNDILRMQNHWPISIREGRSMKSYIFMSTLSIETPQPMRQIKKNNRKKRKEKKNKTKKTTKKQTSKFRSAKRQSQIILRIQSTVMCLSSGTPKIINFPFVPNGKLIIFDVPIFRRITAYL